MCGTEVDIRSDLRRANGVKSESTLSLVDRFKSRFQMPSRRNGFCCWLGGSAPPQISYGLENGGMTLKPIEADIPMPADKQELHDLFAELVDELDLDKQHRDAMFSLPAEKKWQIYCSKKKELDDPNDRSNWPNFYIDKVKVMIGPMDEAELESRTEEVDGLKTALRTKPMSFVTRFIEQEGLQCLLEFLGKMDVSTAHESIHSSVIGCIKALMNNSQGRAHVLAHPTGINVIAQSLATDNIKAKIDVLEILGAVCLVGGGHKKVLQAMLHFQQFAGERTRFQMLITDLERNSGKYKDELGLKTAILSFINAALKCGAGKTHLEFRMHLRYELLMLGIKPIIDKLRLYDNAMLDRHIDFFEMLRNEDERQFAKHFETNHVDTKSGQAMFDLLKKKLRATISYQHLTSILFHTLQLPFGNGGAVQQWQLIDRIVQQIVLQNKDGNPDVEPLEIDVKKLIQQLANENEVKAIQSKLREVQKENDELASKLNKKEHECEVKAEEKEDLLTTINRMHSKLEKETCGHLQAKSDVDRLTAQLNEMQNMLDVERGERYKLEEAIKTGSLPDDAKVGFSNAASALGSHYKPSTIIPPPPTPHMGGLPTNTPPPPPPPLPNAVAPPPPPPAPPGVNGIGSHFSMPGFSSRRREIPKPSQPLKSFNWSKLPDNKITDTIWKDIDDSKMYRLLDLSEFERRFSAYQHKEGIDNEVIKSTKNKELSVIDGRRAQNCTILLSKLKMSNRELKCAIMKVDAQEEIPKDMCEQLLKFVPTPEETLLLSEHEHEIDQMAKADRFLFEMSQIDHYEQRLRALYYKKKFSERISECKPKVEHVLEASTEVQKSRRFKRVLEIVLAFGNFMNRGQRGNASGFKIASLNKIIDTKSSVDRKITLLHYLIEIIQEQFPELIKLNTELSHVKYASKVNLTELEAEVGVLRVGLKDIEKEIEYHQVHRCATMNDKFASTMRDFITVASYNFRELEDLVSEMKDNYSKAASLYAEDKGKIQPDEFFGVFDLFLTSYCDAHIDLERYRKQKEEEEKRAKLEAKLKAEKQNRLRGVKGTGGKDEGEFDELICALRTGEVFGEELAKLKQTRRRRPSGTKLNGTKEMTRERTGKIIRA